MALGREANRFEGVQGPLYLVDRHDEIHVAGHHRLGRPVVDGDAADRTPVQLRAFQGIDHPHDVVSAAGRLPIVKLSTCHASKCTSNRKPRQNCCAGCGKKGMQLKGTSDDG